MIRKKNFLIVVLLSLLIGRGMFNFLTYNHLDYFKNYSMRIVRNPLEGYPEQKESYEVIWQRVEWRVLNKGGFSKQELSRILLIAHETPEYGISKVSWIPKGSIIYQKITKIQQGLKEEFGDKVKLGPALTLHMTILELFVFCKFLKIKMLYVKNFFLKNLTNP